MDNHDDAPSQSGQFSLAPLHEGMVEVGLATTVVARALIPPPSPTSSNTHGAGINSINFMNPRGCTVSRRGDLPDTPRGGCMARALVTMEAFDNVRDAVECLDAQYERLKTFEDGSFHDDSVYEMSQCWPYRAVQMALKEHLGDGRYEWLKVKPSDQGEMLWKHGSTRSDGYYMLDVILNPSYTTSGGIQYFYPEFTSGTDSWDATNPMERHCFVVHQGDIYCRGFHTSNGKMRVSRHLKAKRGFQGGIEPTRGSSIFSINSVKFFRKRPVKE